MMIDDDGSIVRVSMTVKTVNIKTIKALSERSLTQYSPHLPGFSLSRPTRTEGRLTFLFLAFPLREIITHFSHIHSMVLS